MILALLATAAGMAAGAGDEREPATQRPETPAIVSVTQDRQTLLQARARRVARWPTARIERWLAQVPAGRELKRGRATLELATDRQALLRRVANAARSGGGSVSVPERTIAATITLPVVKQALRNNCETAALSMMLAARGVDARQLSLQRELPRSGPPDPRRAGGLPVWGDPELGFVGRVEGGGTDGGYGVYEPPITALAKKRGVKLTRLTGNRKAIYRTLLSGRPVMVWVGLTDGPMMTWRTPSGRRVTGNFGEHTVVLTGLAGDALTVNDPLTGKRLTWTRSYFEELWGRLGRRAVA